MSDSTINIGRCPRRLFSHELEAFRGIDLEQSALESSVKVVVVRAHRLPYERHPGLHGFIAIQHTTGVDAAPTGIEQ